MGTVLGIIILFAIGWAIMKVQNAFWKGANRHVFARNQHTEGQQLTHERLVIGSSVDPDTLQAAIVSGLGLPYDKPVAVHAELFQGPVTPGYVQFCSGTKVMTVFTAGMRTVANPDGGSTLTYRVEKWTLADGIVAGIVQMKFLNRRIEEEARKVDPQIQVRLEPDAERVT